MRPLNLQTVVDFVNENIEDFHAAKAQSLERLNLHAILRRKNPYLFRAKNLTVAPDLVQSLLEAHLSASEETLFGDFLEALAIFISGQTADGRKSPATGIDLEFTNHDVHYIVSIKSGTNWGNSSQQRKQEQDFRTAVGVLKQSRHALNVQPVLGICYGKTRTSHLRGYMKVVGQNFWYLMSENAELYTDIVEPLGYCAKEHNDAFEEMRGRIVNTFTNEFMAEFCDTSGAIDWQKLVVFNSGNLDLPAL